MSEELKPCPCGGQVYVGELKFTGETQWCVGCMNCDRASGKHVYKASAIAAWNRRASPTPPTTEGRGELIKSLQNMRNDLHVNELRNSGSADGNIYSRWGSIVSQATIALLSPPDGDGKQEQARPSGSAPITTGN